MSRYFNSKIFLKFVILIVSYWYFARFARVAEHSLFAMQVPDTYPAANLLIDTGLKQATVVQSSSEQELAGLYLFLGNYYQGAGSEFLENQAFINSFIVHANQTNHATLMVTENKTILKKDAIEKHSKKVYVTQSWDDAVLNDVRLVALLKKFNAKATFFVDPGNLSDEEQPIDGKPKHGYPYWGWFGYGKLSISEIKELYAGFEVGSHTMTHPPIHDLPVDQMRSELVESKRILELWFGKPVKGFAYPGGGNCTALVRQELKAAGYIYARTIGCDPNDFPPRDPYNMSACSGMLPISGKYSSR